MPGFHYNIQDLIQIGKQHKFQLLSKKFMGMHRKHKWKCSQGHIFESVPYRIKNAKPSRGCRECWNKSRPLLRDINYALQLAKDRGFKFLSKKFLGAKHKHTWKCKDGHTWQAEPSAIKGGNGCPKCLRLNEHKVRFVFESLTGKEFLTTRTILNGLELDGYCSELQMAFEYQGKQHYDPKSPYHKTSESFKQLQQRDQEKLDRCLKLGINLFIVPYNKISKVSPVKIEEYIRHFLKISQTDMASSVDWSKFESSRSKLAELKKVAKRKNIQLLSEAYLGAHHKHEFKCIKCHHVWETEARYIKRTSMCPKCVGNIKYSVAEVSNIAKERGMQLLSDTYKNAHTKYNWKCTKCSHIWCTKFAAIKHKTGCPNCAGNIRFTINDMHSLAKERNIKFLSTKYTNSGDKHKWECDICNTIWDACPKDIKQGTGCPSHACVMRKKANTRQLNKSRKEVS